LSQKYDQKFKNGTPLNYTQVIPYHPLEGK